MAIENVKIRAKTRRFITPATFEQWPWLVYVCGIHIGSYASYAEAVRGLRQSYNANMRAGRSVMQYWSARIVFAKAARRG